MLIALSIVLIIVVGVSLVNRQYWQREMSHNVKLLDDVNQKLAGEIQAKLDATGDAARFFNQAEDIRMKLSDAIDKQMKEANVRNEILDYVLTHFQLHLPNPYISRPTFEEKRCLHCMYPDYAGHDKDCIWAKLRPYTSVLYPPPQLTQSDEVTDDANTVLPASPNAPESITDDIEVPEIVQQVASL